MSFSFGTPKTATGFTLPTSTPSTSASAAPGGGFAFNLPSTASATGAAGDSKPGLFASPFKPAATAATTGVSFGLGQSATTSAPTLGFGAPSTQSTNIAFGGSNPQSTASTLGFGGTATPSTGFGASAAQSTASTLGFGAPASQSTAPTLSFGAATSIQSSTPSLSFGAPAATQASAPTLGFGTASTAQSTAPTLSFGAPTSQSTAPSLGFAPATTVAAVPQLGLGTATTTATTTATSGFNFGSTTSTSVAPTVTGTTSSTTAPTGSLTFAQLEDSINKWTIDLEEQGKYFINQAKQLNAWDTLLISNGGKILNLNSSIERVKQQQSQLDQELDFILAQQKELEELVVPLEKELVDIPVTDIDRNQMYQFAEIIDSQLKQISDDLKEIIENINESNKDEEVSNPITQISKILNAHMNSLQWIDRNTAQISRQLEEISKIEDTNRRNLSLNNSISMYQ